MKILNPMVREDLAVGRGLCLNLGSGQRHLPGFYNVDLVDLPGVDIQADLNEPLSELPDNCVTEIYSRHTLEHVTRLIDLLVELHRVCQANARIEIIVPHFSNPYFYSDPTHVRFFGLYSFYYFADTKDQPRRKVPNFYVPQRFRVEQVRLHMLKASLFDKCLRTLFQPLINWNIHWQDWYERRLCRWFPLNDVRYVLRPVKSLVINPFNSKQQAA